MRPMDDSENTSTNPRILDGVSSIGDLIERRLSRRTLLRGGAGAVALALAPGLASCATSDGAQATRFDFPEIPRGSGASHLLPEGYSAQVLLRWGDALFADSPPFTPSAQTAAAQNRQFGYNNDFIGFVPLDEAGRHGLLCVNHEYTSTPLMFPNVASDLPGRMTAELCAVERAAHGASIVEIRETNGRWRVVNPSRYNRRVTADTPMILTGPAAGHPRLATSADPSGRSVAGTINNCAGGITPWGTYLAAEENFNLYFVGAVAQDHPEARNHARYGVPARIYAWGRFDPRFDVSREPNEPNRFGWIVEIDPRNPEAPPKKRTALGRFKHEGAESVVAPDGRVVLYMGDDQRFDYVYKFVTARAYNPSTPEVNRDLLDDGALYVARFDESGDVIWMPLVHGQGPLTAENGFHSQADVLIETRRAADLLGATPMDRPEDVEPNPATGRVYVSLTNNSARTPENVNAANPRANNIAGHVIEIIEPGGDFTALQSRWEILVLCGDPANPEAGATWNVATSANGWFGSPDNVAIDPRGRLWVATDGNEFTGADDGLWALETEGALRGAGRAFFRAPVGAEVCGPRFAPDGRTLFLAVQHPGDGSSASYEAPTTRWPDFDAATPPRPAVLAIRRNDGGAVGG
ncbi:MAG: PhoX family phosphatase [Hyphomonadaceae bacterium]|nr:PhoX family phosphatase [Hyphomonadaceae bacterium]